MQDHLHAELSAAYEQTLEEHKKSMAAFLDRIASLCEGQGVSPAQTAFACGLVAENVKLDLDCNRETNGAEDVSAAGKGPAVCAGSDLSLRLMKQPLSDKVCAAMPSLQPTALPAECSPVTLELPRELGISTPADDREDAAMLGHEFTVPRLPFIDATGTIHRVESPLERFCGTGFKRFKSMACLNVSCMHARTGRFASFVDSHLFKIMSTAMIMLNYYWIIYQTDYKMSHLGQEEPYVMFVVELFFTCFYVWELSCQVLAYRREFFLGEEMVWNLFDMIIVLVSVFELMVTLMGGKGINLSFLRVLRFLKLSRVLRMFSALRLMKEIRIMVDALAGSFLIFVFCSLMLAMFYSIFAIFFVQGMTTYLEDEAQVDQKVLQSIKSDFGSVSSTMLALFMSVSGGNDWSQYHDTVASIGVTYNYLWLFFIGFSSIAFLNVITGVFAEKALSLAHPTNDELMVRRTEKEMNDARELVHLLERHSGSHSARSLSRESFETFLGNPEVVKYLEVRGLKPCSARRFFTLLSEIHQTDTVDYGTFVSACVKMDGTASSIDIHVLSAEVKSMQLKQNHLSKFLTQQCPGHAHKKFSPERSSVNAGLQQKATDLHAYLHDSLVRDDHETTSTQASDDALSSPMMDSLEVSQPSTACRIAL